MRSFRRLSRADSVSQAVAVVLFLALMGVSTLASAYDGELDSSWDGTGIVTWGDPGTTTRAMGTAIQCDGKIVVVGTTNVGGDPSDLMVARFNSDGSLDSSFASAGIFTVSPGNMGAGGWDVVIQPDGMIVAAGYAADALVGASFLVVRLIAAGVLDSGFSGDGIQKFNFGGQDRGGRRGRSPTLPVPD